jgi:hypothetical protein
VARKFPRLKSTLKDLPFLVLAAIIARILKDLLLTPLGLYYNPLRDEFDLTKLVVNWVILSLLFFALIYLRNLIWGKPEE